MKIQSLRFSSFILLFISAVIAYLITNKTDNLLTTSKTETHQDTIWISAVGDLMCHSPQIKDALKSDGRYDFSHMFEFVKPIISESDLAIGNLETVLAGSEKRFSGYPLFNSPDEFVYAIKDAGFDILITSNNHCLDRGFYGLERTIKILDSLAIKHSGTYSSKEDAEKILIINIKGIKLAILSYTYGTNGIAPPKDKEFCVAYIDTQKIKLDIEKAKQNNVDKIIVYLHWGNEYQRFPDALQKNLSKFLFENDVDIILGTHPHVIQPAELKLITTKEGKQKKVFVIYSMGNFISNQRDRFTDSGVIVHLSLIKNSFSGETCIDTVLFTSTYVSKINRRFRVIPTENALNNLKNNDSLWIKLLSTEEKKLRQVLNDFQNHIWMKSKN
ncbi:MAG: CapA family protein [Ignavibacteria bacterium]